MKISKKQKVFFSKLLTVVLLLVLVFIFINMIKGKRDNFQGIDSEGSYNDHIENFMAYPNQQKFCPNIYNSKSSFWTKLPQKYGNGLMCKFCCTSCYYLVSKAIYCGNNETGMYKICKLKPSDINNLRNYHTSKNLDFDFPESKLNKLLGSDVLKMKKDNIYYPIQIIMTLEKLNQHEDQPTLANQLYKDSYDCN